MRSRFLSTLAKLSLLSILAATGCGSSDSGDTDKFVGTWKYTSGTVTTSCPGFAPDTRNITGNVSVNKGSTSDLVVVDGECSLKFTVNGSNTASAIPAQSCTSTSAEGTVVATYNDVVFSSQDGATSHVSGTFTVAITTSTGLSLTCQATQSADLVKL